MRWSLVCAAFNHSAVNPPTELHTQLLSHSHTHTHTAQDLWSPGGEKAKHVDIGDETG
jgi:hypothetical protein